MHTQELNTTSDGKLMTLYYRRAKIYLLPLVQLFILFAEVYQVQNTVDIEYCDYDLMTNIGYCDYLSTFIWFPDRTICMAMWQLLDIVTIWTMAQGSHTIQYL